MVADRDGKEDGAVLSEDEPIAKRVRRAESDVAAAPASSTMVPSVAADQLSPEDEEFHDALFADLAEEQPASVSVAGDNASIAGTIAPSASLVPVLVPPVPDTRPPVPRDEQSLLAEAVAAEWMERMDALSPEAEVEQQTRLQETPLHLLLPLLCPRMHVAGTSAAGAAGKSISFCRKKVPSVLLSVFQSLLRGIVAAAPGDGGGADAGGWFVAASKFVEPDLAALTPVQSAQVHRAAVQMHRWVRLLSTTCAPRPHHHHRRRRPHALGVVLSSLSSSSSDDSDSDASSDDEEDRLILFSMPGSQSCACDSAVDFVAEMQRMAYEMLVPPRRSSSGEDHHPRSYGMMTPADVAIECGLLSFLALSVPPAAPISALSDSSVATATTTTMAAPLPLLQLLQDVAVERPAAPLHLFEHALAICPELRTLCREGSATITAAGSTCAQPEHHAPATMALPLVDKLLPAPRCCPSCALAVPPSLLLWHALLSGLLHPFPDDMLRVHLPHSSIVLLPAHHPPALDAPGTADSAEATAADDSAAHATSVVAQPSLTLADACTLLLHRVSVLAVDVQDQSKRSEALTHLRSCMTKLRVLFVSLGNEQALQLLHGVLLPLQQQQQQHAAAANGEDKTVHFLAHVWRQLIGQIALGLEHRLHDAL
jgi:hypothetical protein